MCLMAAMSMVSCRNHIDIEEKYYPKETSAQKEFAEQFLKLYGEVSPDITWLTATEGNVTLDLGGLPAGEYAVKFFTGDPSEKNDYCYQTTEVIGIKSGDVTDFKFDYPIGLEYVYATAIASDGTSYTQSFSTGEDEIVTFGAPDVSLYEQPAMRYRMCFEGFSAVDEKEGLDFDYNDVVIEIEYVRGQETAKVSVQAAGCECPVMLALRRSASLEAGKDEVLFEEVHDALGFCGVYDYFLDRYVYLALNTGINTGSRIQYRTIDLGDEQGLSVSKLAYKFFAYFSKPEGKNGKKDKNSKPKASFIPQKPGSAFPMAMLIADPNWKCPHEAFRLSASYSLFRSWIADPDEYPFWYGGRLWKEANER